MLQTWCKPWHSRNLIHPKLDLWANTSYDYCNAFEVQYGNTNCTCHHTNCTSKLLACGFSIAGALTQELYLEGLPQEQGLYLCCYETEKEITSYFRSYFVNQQSHSMKICKFFWLSGLREINLGKFKASKMAILTILKGLSFFNVGTIWQFVRGEIF